MFLFPYDKKTPLAFSRLPDSSGAEDQARALTFCRTKCYLEAAFSKS